MSRIRRISPFEAIRRVNENGIKPEDVPPESHITEARRLASGQISLFGGKIEE